MLVEGGGAGRSDDDRGRAEWQRATIQHDLLAMGLMYASGVCVGWALGTAMWWLFYPALVLGFAALVSWASAPGPDDDDGEG